MKIASVRKTRRRSRTRPRQVGGIGNGTFLTGFSENAFPAAQPQVPSAPPTSPKAGETGKETFNSTAAPPQAPPQAPAPAPAPTPASKQWQIMDQDELGGPWSDVFKRHNLSTLLRNRNEETTVEGKKQILQEYLTLIQKQNELFEEVPSVFMLHCGLGDYTILTIKDKLGCIKPNIDYIEGHVNVVESFVTNSKPSSNKFKYLRSPIDLPTCVQLLLFPRRFTNVFIESLANILIVLKQTPSLLTGLAAIDNGVARDFFMVNIEENMLVQTQQHDISDNRFFFLDTENRNTESFWNSFITDMSGAIGASGPPQSSDSWVTLVVKVFSLYKQKGVDSMSGLNVLTLFDNGNTSETVQKTNPIQIPTEYLDIALTAAGTTLRQILGIVSFEKLQFIIQLAYLIHKNEHEVLDQIASETGFGSGSGSEIRTPQPPPSTQ